MEQYSEIYQKSIVCNYTTPNVKKCNQSLNIFLTEISTKIEETQRILDKMKYELYLYQTLMTVDRKYIVKEASFNNLLNLKLFNNIDNKKYIFINKMNEINNELNNFHNFEYKPINKINNQNNEKYNNVNNKISIQKNVNDKIINKNIYNNKNKIEEKTYLQYFKEPEKPLYQIYGIKLEDIERRNSYIINKLINISVDLEEEYNINERNSFFEILKNIGEISIKLSYL